MPRRRAIAACVIFFARSAPDLGCVRCGEWGRPTRARRVRERMSRSNSAKRVNSVASARPLGVDTSSASVNETHATPKGR
jgi:hypothetical protein